MHEEKIKSADEAGMEIYEYIVDNAEHPDFDLDECVDKLCEVDTCGQFLCSTARYLAAVDRARYEKWIAPLVEAAINKDKDRNYIGSLLQALWGEDYRDRAASLCESDNNFRRIYKRIFPTGVF